MNKFMRTAIGGAILVLAATPNTALAKSHFSQGLWRNNNHSQWNRNLRYGYRHAPYYDYRYDYGYYPNSYGLDGGFVGAYLPDNYAVDDAPVGAVIVAPPIMPASLNCKRNQETKTVPSEDGGEKQIRITRC